MEAKTARPHREVTRDGIFVKAWGRKGSGPGEFDAPHSITIDSQGRLFVADRANSRIQIFDQDGTFLDQWKQFGRPSGVYIDRTTCSMPRTQSPTPRTTTTNICEAFTSATRARAS